jgi:hypothetical protein
MKPKALKTIDKVADESGNKHVFIQGTVFGMAHALAFLNELESKEEVAASIEVLLEMIDEEYLKPAEQ